MRIGRAVLLIACLLVAFAVALPAGALLRPGSAACDRLVRWFCRALLAALGVRLRLAGARLDGPGRLIVANHVSWIDVLVLGSLVPVSFLAKREVAGWPVIAAFARVAGTLLVDRSRRMRIPGVNRAMAGRLAAGRSVLLFPEGTTHDGRRLGPFRTAHLGCLADRLRADPVRAACPVQAVALSYDDPVAAWVGEATLAGHVWAMLARRRVRCTVVAGPISEVARGFDRKALGRSLAREVAVLLAAGRGGDCGLQQRATSRDHPSSVFRNAAREPVGSAVASTVAAGSALVEDDAAANGSLPGVVPTLPCPCA